jgi:hypothetical protein
MTQPTTQPLRWTHRVIEVPDGGLRQSWQASEAERSALAAALEVEGCEAAGADYTIGALGAGRYRMTGRVRASLAQRCVVSLEPLATRIDEPFEVEFRPPESITPESAAELEVLALPEIEPIEHGAIAAGRLVFETLLAAVDPYPRKEGAEFDWTARAGAEAAKGPFASLSGLKKDR